MGRIDPQNETGPGSRCTGLPGRGEPDLSPEDEDQAHPEATSGVGRAQAASASSDERHPADPQRRRSPVDGRGRLRGEVQADRLE